MPEFLTKSLNFWPKFFLSGLTREMVFKDQRGFAMLFSFQNSIDSVCFCFHAHRLNTDLKIEQHSKTTLIFKNQNSRGFDKNCWVMALSYRNISLSFWKIRKKANWWCLNCWTCSGETNSDLYLWFCPEIQQIQEFKNFGIYPRLPR